MLFHFVPSIYWHWKLKMLHDVVVFVIVVQWCILFFFFSKNLMLAMQLHTKSSPFTKPQMREIHRCTLQKFSIMRSLTHLGIWWCANIRTEHLFTWMRLNMLRASNALTLTNTRSVKHNLKFYFSLYFLFFILLLLFTKRYLGVQFLTGIMYSMYSWVQWEIQFPN